MRSGRWINSVIVLFLVGSLLSISAVADKSEDTPWMPPPLTPPAERTIKNARCSEPPRSDPPLLNYCAKLPFTNYCAHYCLKHTPILGNVCVPADDSTCEAVWTRKRLEVKFTLCDAVGRSCKCASRVQTAELDVAIPVCKKENVSR